MSLKIQIAGIGCSNCEKFYELVKQTVAENGIPAEVEKINDPREFAKLGVISTPALIVNGKILSAGKVPVKHTLVQWLINELAKSE